MEAGADSDAAVATEEAAEEGGDDALLSKAQMLISRVTASQANPNPRILHALASMLEAQESRYVQEYENSSLNSGRTSHSIGKLGNVVQENDEFYELISYKFLSESRYSVSVCSAAARLLLSCSSTWMYPHVLDDAVLDNIKCWLMEDTVKLPSDEHELKCNFGSNKPTDTEMLRTYATGLLAVSLAGSVQVVEDILRSGLSAKLMRYLRVQVLGESNNSQRDASFPTETKHGSLATSTRGREENRCRSRQVFDASRLDSLRGGDEGFLGDQSADRDYSGNVTIRQARGKECWDIGGEPLIPEPTDCLSEVMGLCEMVEEDAEQTGEGWHNRDLLDGKSRYGERHGAGRATRDEDTDENVRDDSSRRRGNRLWPRTRGKGRNTEGTIENERTLTSPLSGLRIGQGRTWTSIDRNLSKNEDIERVLDSEKYSSRFNYVDLDKVEDDIDRLKECNIGSKDISDMVKKATRSAEAEAREANASVEAIKAAGDAAAELVKTSALEAWRNTNDEEAAVLAASKAASSVVDAAIATEISRSSVKVDEDLKCVEPKMDEESGELFILDNESLARLRERYCIQCLETLGKYVEALGPVLHEKGVDICVGLLQRCFKHKETPDDLALLPEVLKLICALAAHRKFAALFVDRGGIQKLISVPRVPQTFFGLSSCIFTFGSLQGIMERVCALPSDVVHQVVELALQLLQCPQDQARKNAAIFFAAAFVFRGVLDPFDTQEGLQKMLNLLHAAASARSSENSGTLSLSNTTLRIDQSHAEVLTASEKQVAYHTCVALRQYFRAHLLLLVDYFRPDKNSQSTARNTPSARASYKPLDISNEVMDAVFLQIQHDRKLGSAFVRAHWPVVDKFLAANGHNTMLELCQAPPADRYLHDLAQYALGVLHVVTFVRYSRKLIVNASLSNGRIGMAIILDAANGAAYFDPEVIRAALNVLVNLVCPPPSISNKPLVPAQDQWSVSVHTLNGPSTENKERLSERNIPDHTVPLPMEKEPQECNGEPNQVERGGVTTLSTPFPGSSSRMSDMSSRVVGNRRISLGPGPGCAGLAVQLEQGYHQAREAVRANNGIKLLLHLLHPRMTIPPPVLDCIRALACQILHGLARDDTIAEILTKLQVGKKLSDLIRDSVSQASGTEQCRWRTELAQVAIELIAIVTNSGRASSLVATDAASPTLRRIERAAIAAATPITYHSRELLLLIHEHLQASGLTASASLLQEEAELTPSPSLAALPCPHHPTPVQETTSLQLQWPSGRASCVFLSKTLEISPRIDAALKSDSALTCSAKKPLVLSANFSRTDRRTSSSSVSKLSGLLKSPSSHTVGPETLPVSNYNTNVEPPLKSPIVLSMKRKIIELKDFSCGLLAKRLATSEIVSHSSVSQTPYTGCGIGLPTDTICLISTPSYAMSNPCNQTTCSSTHMDNSDDLPCQGTPGALTMPVSQISLPSIQPGNTERMTLDSLVMQYLKHQHRQCPCPITTLPPLSLLHPHVCPESSRNLKSPANVTVRVCTREFRKQYGGIHAHRRDRQFVYSRFRPWRTCRDDSALLTCTTFLGDFALIATGSYSGELKIFYSNNGNVLESYSSHQSPVTHIQSALSGERLLILSSGTHDVRLWEAASVGSGPVHSFEGCKAACFSPSGTMFAALSSEAARCELLLYDIQTNNAVVKLLDGSNNQSGLGRVHTQSLVHFSPSDKMLLWNGALWDRRCSGPIHRFDQFTDYGGGGFHPAGNEVIINSEVWDLRKLKLLRSVPSLDQTVIKFNAGGDVIYATLRRNLEDVSSAIHTRRARHPLFPAFRTIDAVNYSDIATVPVGRCVLDFATEPKDSFVGVVAMDDHDDLSSSVRLYEVGRRRSTNDDSDPEDGSDTDTDDEAADNDVEVDVEQILSADSEVDSDFGDTSNDEDGGDDELDGDDDGGDEFNIDEGSMEGEDGNNDSEVVESFSGGEEGDVVGNSFGF